MADDSGSTATAGEAADAGRVLPAALQALVVKLLVRKGMFAAEADVAAQRMIEADLRGSAALGTRLLPRLLQAMDLGEIDPRAQVLTLRETPAIAVLDGGGGLGHVVATRAMQLAIEKARHVGTGTVAVRHSQTLGSAGVYALLAARAGLIGQCTTTALHASVAAYGSTLPATADCTLAWGIPVGDDRPLVFETTCAGIDWEAVGRARESGTPLPDGCALEAQGQPTTDAALARTLLPAAGLRGYGLALVHSVLAGPLAGGRMSLHKPRSPFADGSGHFFSAIDPAQFVDPEQFAAELAGAVAAIRALPPNEGFDAVRLPGEHEWEQAERWTREGIPLHPEHARRLAELARAMKIPLPWDDPAGPPAAAF